jgi:methylated-DNA-protein-cysteine methyltransferase-like protein
MRANRVSAKPEFLRKNREIYGIVKQIPEGTVATYGQVGELAGVGPRQVGQALKGLPPGTDCPWHRVINSQGRVSLRTSSGKAHLIQEEILESEGVLFKNGRVDLDVYRWYPEH